ncbi:MAG: DUF4261 domain-containing protein [Mucilaginibacter sp.]|uniref:DUF4261 domain-containing protein n=1 Tax=Mucilaginibacter sp. TaxID=1882438 RepID=UPI003263562B
MGLFNFLKKKPKTSSTESNFLLSMPIFNNNDSYQVDKIIENLKSHWGLEVTEVAGDNTTTSFMIDGETVAIAYMPVPIPWDDIEGTAKYAYNWSNALTDLREHTGHAFVTIMAGKKSPLERYKILSKLLYSTLITSGSIGVYQGSQSLLIPRSQYLATIEEAGGSIPVALWIYIGLRKPTSGNNAYTYGLKDFEKNEIEIIDSELSLEELYDFLLNITSYIISNDITLKSGETIGFTAEQKIPITLSKGEQVTGESFKLKM